MLKTENSVIFVGVARWELERPQTRNPSHMQQRDYFSHTAEIDTL
jgi:hypothetical protein